MRRLLARALSATGAALSRLGHRLHHEAPSDYAAGHSDGWSMGLITAAHTGTREDGGRLLEHFGLNHSL